MALHYNAALSFNDSSINHRHVRCCLYNPKKMKLKLTKDTQADLEDIRELIEKKNYSEFRGDRNRLKLSEVYREVMSFSGFKVNGINATCDSCINDAVNTVYNFVTYHEQKPGEKDAVIVEFAGGKPSIEERASKVVEMIDEMYSGPCVDSEGNILTADNVSNQYDLSQMDGFVKRMEAEPLPVGHTDVVTKENAIEKMTSVYYSDIDYKDLLVLAKEKGYKGGRIPKKELIEFLTKKGE